jgi:glycosyltransferase involved in cell wall biosynthesis
MARLLPSGPSRSTTPTLAPLTLVPPSGLPDPLLDLTVVVPYYNPGPVLRSTVERAVEVLRGTGISFEIVAVSDGSTDGSDASLEGVHPDVVVRVVLPHAGKGRAVRAGLAQGRGRYLGFIDGDGDVPPELLAEFVAVVEREQPDVVLGSKRHPDSQVVYPIARRMYSWGYQQLVRLLFHLDVRDTQAGIKLVRREVLAEVLPLMVEEGYAFDLEMLVIARRLGYRDLVEAPVRIGRRFSSTVSRRVVVEMLRDTFAIWWRLRTGRDRRPAPSSPA